MTHKKHLLQNEKDESLFGDNENNVYIRHRL